MRNHVATTVPTLVSGAPPSQTGESGFRSAATGDSLPITRARDRGTRRPQAFVVRGYGKGRRGPAGRILT